MIDEEKEMAEYNMSENTTIKTIDDDVVCTSETEEKLKALIDQLFIRVAKLEADLSDLQ